jgi:putative intracellular protease/amidase
VPVNVAKVLREHYLKHGRFLRAAVPTLLFQSVDDEMGKALGVPSGVLVGHVAPGSEAELAGFMAGDVIISVDGASISTREQADVLRFNWRLVTREVGSSVTFGLLRTRAGGEPEAREIVFQLRQDGPAPRSGNQIGEIPARLYETLGLGIQEAGAKSRLTFNLPDAPGVLVVGVQPGTPAQKAGLAQGDILTRVEGVATPDPDRFAEALEKALQERKKAIRLEVQRQKQTIQTAMAPRYVLAGKKVAVLVPPQDAEWMELLRRGLVEGGAELVMAAPSGIQVSEVDALLLVGGPGAVSFQEDEGLAALVREAVKAKKVVAALGPASVAVVKAEPSLLGKKMTTSEDQAEKAMALQAKYTGKPVERDGKLVTGTGFDKPAAKEFLKLLTRALASRGEE